MGGGNKKNKKKPKTKEHKRRTSSVVGKKSLATDNDYTGSCIQPTNQRRCLKKRKRPKKFSAARPTVAPMAAAKY